ncbi:MAG TPA: hypothetical protein VHD87_17105 [Acidimicrobiales bacterium]|nr:hypothetical protein [Acidimicrobiales bacterium]
MRIKFLHTALVVGAGASLVLSAAAPAHAADWDSGKVSAQSVTSTASKALDWLEGQFAANGHHLKSGYTDTNNQFQTFDDAGLTIDGLLALAAGGRTADSEVAAGRDWMKDNVDAYVTGSDPNSLYAGAVGKAMVFAIVYDLDPNNVGGHDLEANLCGRMQANGHFTDDATDFQSGDPVDYSNGIGDALDVLALAATDNGTPAQAVSYLLLQQCPNGGFRSELADTKCTDNAKADLDATSFALMALAVQDESSAVTNAVNAGVADLKAAQTNDGAFGGNANSSGLAASVLRGLGDAPTANKAATFVKSLQLTSGDNNGAILLDQDTHDSAVGDGLDTQGKTLAARATAQGVMALGLPAYPMIGTDEPVEPSTTIALSSSNVQPGGTMTVSGGGFATGEKVRVTVASDPVIVGEPLADTAGFASQSFVLPSSVGAGSHTITLTGETSGVTVSAPLTVTVAAAAAATTSTTLHTTIVRTGTSSGEQSKIAFGLLAFGLGLVLVARRRRLIYPFQK